jgi:hypothetical protein
MHRGVSRRGHQRLSRAGTHTDACVEKLGRKWLQKAAAMYALGTWPIGPTTDSTSGVFLE